MAQVALINLGKTFRSSRGEEVRALRGVSLEIKSGELLVVLGPSGSGKTTLLRLIAGLERPTSGAIQIDGKSMENLDPARRPLAMVFQQPALYPHLTARANLSLALHARRLSLSEVERRVEWVSGLLELGPFLNRRPAELSGGEQQRVALGRALVGQPKVLLLDEPLSSLDSPLRQQLRQELTRLQAELGVTMIYVTHDQAEAMTLGHRIALLRAGSIEQAGPPLELYQHPVNQFVAGFLGSPPMNFFKGVIAATDQRLLFKEMETDRGLGELALVLPDSLRSRLEPHTGRTIQLGLRPEHLQCHPIGILPPQWPATVQRLQHTGAILHIHMATGAHRFVVAATPEFPWRDGEMMAIKHDPAQARFFDSATGLRIA